MIYSEDLSEECSFKEDSYPASIYPEIDSEDLYDLDLIYGHWDCPYSKNCIHAGTMDKLIALAESADLKTWIEAMFTGEKINATEDRSVLYTALRAPKDAVVEVDGELAHDSSTNALIEYFRANK